MANTNSNIVTALAASKTDQTAPLKGVDTCGLPLYIRGKVTCPATPTVNDTLTLVPKELIPNGAKPAPELSWLYTETDPGTELALDIGVASNPDLLADNLSLTVASNTATGDGTSGPLTGHIPFTRSGTVPLQMSAPAVATAEDIIATVVTSNTVSQTVIQFAIAYYATA